MEEEAGPEKEMWDWEKKIIKDSDKMLLGKI